MAKPIKIKKSDLVKYGRTHTLRATAAILGCSAANVSYFRHKYGLTKKIGG